MKLTFLKKLGQFLAKGEEIVAGVAPAILPFLGASKSASVLSAAVNDLSVIASLVVQAETWLSGDGTGAEKFAKALPLVVNALRASQILAGQDVDDEALLESGAGKILNGMVDVLNAVKPNIKTAGNPVTPAIKA
jgi:hypothetical protein